MKTRTFLLILLIALITVSCIKRGESIQRLDGSETNLPDELKGLKVYVVGTGDGEAVKVAILNGQINSATYTSGKTTQTTIILNKDRYNERTIEADKILFENDEMILIKKR